MAIGNLLCRRAVRVAVLLAVLAVVFAPSKQHVPAIRASGLSETWQQVFPTASPGYRWAASMVYAPNSGGVLLFGGRTGTDGNTYLDETWLWNGVTWIQQFPQHKPPARGQAAMAYDASHNTVVLFGGFGNGGSTFLGDTWLWSGSDWTQGFPAVSPPPRSSANMVYDANAQVAVMFGGDVLNSSGNTDTWTWNGVTWKQEAPAHNPPTRILAGMAYDAVHRGIVMYGGVYFDQSSLIYVKRNDTWIWSNGDWALASPTSSPPPLSDANMAFDAESNLGN